MDYLSTTETAKKWGISVQRVRVLCQEERIAGVTKVGKCYMIPASAPKPADFRKPDSVDLKLPPSEEETEVYRFRTLYNFVRVGLAIYKKCDGVITMVRRNNYLRERTGVPEEKALNVPVEQQMEFIYPEDIDAVLHMLEACFQTRKEQELEFRIWDYFTSQYRWFRVNLVYGMADERGEYAFSNFEDITEQKKLLEAMKEQQAALERAGIHARVHYIEYDVRTKLTRLNKYTANAYGFPNVLEDFPRQICRPDAVFPGDYRLYCDKFREVLEGKKKEVIFTARIHDCEKKEYLWRRVRFTGAYDGEGQLIKIDGSSQDINEYLDREADGRKNDGEQENYNQETN